jgi:hypothetical protein
MPWIARAIHHGATASNRAGVRCSPGENKVPFNLLLSKNVSRTGFHRSIPIDRFQSTDSDRSILKRDVFKSQRHRALVIVLSMIFSENRFALFRIML